MKNKFLILSIVMLIHMSLSQAKGMNSEVREEDRGIRALMKASVAPYTLEFGKNAGGALGWFITEWVCTRYYAPKPGSWIRWVYLTSSAGNSVEEWGPVGEKVGGYVGSLALTATTTILMDRYYFSWKRLAACISDCDASLSKLRKGDVWKICESFLVSAGLGYFVYWDLKKKE